MPVYSSVAAMQHWLVVCMRSMRQSIVVSCEASHAGSGCSGAQIWTVECCLTVLAAGGDDAVCCGCPLVLVGWLTDGSSGQALLTPFVQ